MRDDPIVAREKELIGKITRIHRELYLAQTKTALDYLTDPELAAGYVLARAEDAEFLRQSLQWSAPSPHIRVAGVNGLVVVREVIPRSAPSITIWGYVTVGRAYFPVESEDQVLAYLLSRSAIGV